MSTREYYFVHNDVHVSLLNNRRLLAHGVVTPTKYRLENSIKETPS